MRESLVVLPAISFLNLPRPNPQFAMLTPRDILPQILCMHSMAVRQIPTTTTTTIRVSAATAVVLGSFGFTPKRTNVQQQGTQLGNWLTREQAKELLA